MTIHMRPYAGAADPQRILDLKRTCTTPENIYDTPIFSELHALLAPLPQDPAAGRPPWEDEQGGAIGHLHRRAFSLWCRCHEHETRRRALLEEAGFTPLPARDLRLVCALDISFPAAQLP